jgi:hypothetical protein
MQKDSNILNMLRLEMYSSVVLNRNGMPFSSDIIIDPKTKYTTNSLGFRTPEFNGKAPDFVFAGCSHTWGWGIDESLIWGNRIAKNKGIETRNLGISSGAITTIIDNLIAYFDKFGKPKVLFCLFPSLARMNVWTDRSVFVGRHGFDSLRDTAVPYKGNFPKYSQKPHKLEEVLTSELPTLLSLKYILNFEQYCMSNNIIFKYAFWDPTDDLMMDGLPHNNSYNGYVKSDSTLWVRDGIIEVFNGSKDCHTPSNELEQYAWLHGMDIELSSLPHIGAHRQIHYYELFLNEYDKIYS